MARYGANRPPSQSWLEMKKVKCYRCADYLNVPVCHPDNGNLCASCERALLRKVTRESENDTRLSGDRLSADMGRLYPVWGYY